MSYIDWTPSQIATRLPGATAILFAHNINFSVSGGKTLQEMIHQMNLDENEIISSLDELKRETKSSIDLKALNNNKLIEYILTRYHQVHRQQLIELIRLSQLVESTHTNHHLCPKGLTNHLCAIQKELVSHMQKEEEILFPMLSIDFNPMVLGPINVMKSEHEHHIANIEKICIFTNDLALHPEMCNIWKALYLGLQEFTDDINTHINLENNILFEQTIKH